MANLFFIEVKGRIEGSDSITLTYNERQCAKNSPNQFRLAISIISKGIASTPKYISNVDYGTPGFASESETYYLSKLLLENDYEVHGTLRRSSSINTSRIDPLISQYSKNKQSI